MLNGTEYISINVSWWVFTGVAVIIGTVVLVMVNYTNRRVVRMNPVEVLKRE